MEKLPRDKITPRRLYIIAFLIAFFIVIRGYSERCLPRKIYSQNMYQKCLVVVKKINKIGCLWNLFS
jgi:hypothetical protein